MAKIANQGNNILNFCYAMHMILTARDANTRLDLRQKEAMRYLEQLQINNWKYIKPFCNGFIMLTAISGNYYNPDLGEKHFSKLLRELGKEYIKLGHLWT